MNQTPLNPFGITKADDFSDQEINDYWVDVPVGGFFQLAKPTSPMSMIIMGGKGSGKTHLMRHFSYPLQKIRHGEKIIEGIKTEGHIGIYLRCGDLNSPRFKGKKQETEEWAKIFSYYMDLWVSQTMLYIIQDAFKDNAELKERESSICQEIISLFTYIDFDQPKTLYDLSNLLNSFQRKIDMAVNESGYTYKINIRPRTKLGGLTFGIPKIMANYLPVLNNTIFLYLIDEFENIEQEQQKYFNTLIRQKQNPSSFRIGVRLYGIDTYETYNAGEVNKQDSEYEMLYLDDKLRSGKGYNKFAKELCIKRLINCGYFARNDRDKLESILPSFFTTYSNRSYSKDETDEILSSFSGEERPYFTKLRKRLQRGALLYKLSEDDVNNIIKMLSFSKYPLLEKTNIYLLYKYMYSGINPQKASLIVSSQCVEFIKTKPKRGNYYQAFRHFNKDMLAQLLFDFGEKQRYLGIDTFISMSCGCPKNFLIILKNIYRWSLFNGESPFQKGPISIKAQQGGVLESSNWFFEDARQIGEDGRIIRQAITNLGNFFREVRFSDKPSECSLSAFSTNIPRTSQQAQNAIEEATEWSLLINITRGQRHRNTRRLDVKYQLNSMLAPRWDLPIYRRGTIDLNHEEINVLFDPACFDNGEILTKRTERMKAPFFGKTFKKNKQKSGGTASLWE